ncbi:MAG: carboxypeptidase-like regulatory domain-containing protein, partial [Tannerella sp.]|nr:carboxypeptidase-like regulatory domain-containing protein [Tannerella sp.]
MMTLSAVLLLMGIGTAGARSGDSQESLEPAQSKTRLSGTVIDRTGESVIGANIVEKSNVSNGTITDVDGKFSLDVSPGATLVVSYIGYVTQEIAVGNRTQLQIVLQEDLQILDEVVVVAYGTAKKKDLTGAITAIDTKIIGLQSTSSVTRSLEGVVPGLQVAAVDGQPGLDMGIRIRGLGTAEANNANALVVIDGVPMESSDAAHSNPLAT